MSTMSELVIHIPSSSFKEDRHSTGKNSMRWSSGNPGIFFSSTLLTDARKLMGTNMSVTQGHGEWRQRVWWSLPLLWLTSWYATGVTQLNEQYKALLTFISADNLLIGIFDYITHVQQLTNPMDNKDKMRDVTGAILNHRVSMIATMKRACRNSCKNTFTSNNMIWGTHFVHSVQWQ